MATFTKGQRVKFARPMLWFHLKDAEAVFFGNSCDGTNGVISDYRFDGRGQFRLYDWQFDPLTPPAADEWAQSKVREVTKPVYTEPERVKEGDTIRIRLPNRYQP